MVSASRAVLGAVSHRTLFVVTVLTSTVSLLLGCPGRTTSTSGQADAHAESALFVQDVLAAQAVAAGAQCTFTSDPTQPYISSGVLDVALRQEYDPTYLLGNQLPPDPTSQGVQTEANIITVQGVKVRITDASGNQLDTGTRLASATIYPASGSVPGYAPVTVTTLDQGVLQGDLALQNSVGDGGTARLVTYVTFFGQTTGGMTVQSDEFEFPVDVCRGCLIEFPAGEDDPSSPRQPNCLGGSSSSTPVTSPCVEGQDFVVDCSQCPGIPECQGAVTDGGK
jgi:hypothetical protein